MFTFATVFQKQESLKNINVYKRIAAAALVALYAFIVTPVRLWHHHAKLRHSVQGCIKEGDLPGIQLLKAGHHIYCPLDSDHYTIHMHTPSFFLEGDVVSVSGSRNGCYHISSIAVFIYHAANKGRPFFNV
ncbi:hypothetical protein [Filimonas lacunae]|nr:hypothetical protein [Filimonas lacunae]BAV07423.1 hypothetical protein FLA_3448 [Filimonas lacunae]